jgi:hypothetical protein
VKAGPHLARFAEVTAYFFKAPHTVPELRAWLGTSNQDISYRYVDALRGEGLLYIREWRKGRKGPPAPVYAWQPSVGELPDAPRPVREPA